MLRLSAMVSGIIGATGSLFFTLQAGRNSPSPLLIILFLGWVLSPFIALMIPAFFENKWKGLPRRGLYILSILIALFSLLIYSAAVFLYSLKPSKIFLLFPLFSWLLILMILVLNRLRKRKPSPPGGPPV